MAIHEFQALLLGARSTRYKYRSEVAEAALGVEGGDPDLTAEDIENHEHRLRTIPADGFKLRTHAAAVDVSLTDLLLAVRWWPPLGGPVPSPSTAGPNLLTMPVLEAIKALCLQRGAKIVADDPEAGRIVIELPR